MNVLKHPAKTARRVAWLERRALSVVVPADERRRLLEEADRLAGQLRAADRCRRCGRHLEDDDSVKAGYGPDCLAIVAAEAAR